MTVYGNLKAEFVDLDANVKVTENLGYITANLLSNDNDQVKRDVQTIVTFIKGIDDLNKLDYNDTSIDYSVSLNQISNEQGVDFYG